MLIEFSVKNFLSILETQTLSMVASNASELQKNNTFQVSTKGIPRLLRSAAIYGPNASGKSNLIKAIAFVEKFVLNSAKESQENEPIAIKPFLFNKISRTEPSEFEVIFIEGGIRYQYGFSVNNTRVTREWLLAYPEGRVQRWFERQFDSTSETYKWYFGDKFKGRKNILKESTRSNALFLSTAVQLNNETLKPIYNWFYRKLRTVGIAGISTSFTIKMCKSDAGKKRILEFLNSADITIKDIHIETKQFGSHQSKLLSQISDIVGEDLHKKLDDLEYDGVSFLHPIEGTSETVALDLNEESVGTIKLFAFAGPWLDVIENGYIIVADEFNNSMHPLLIRFLISLLNNSETNKGNAQLIFSTHDSSILDNEIFRRDQIWFTEKDEHNSTRLYPLSDFTPRKGEALQKGYLKGRYGALPFIGELGF